MHWNNFKTYPNPKQNVGYIKCLCMDVVCNVTQWDHSSVLANLPPDVIMGYL